MSKFQEFWKSNSPRVEKPGNSTHTPKWDRCVAHVSANNPDADPYAVCTAMLGDESFKAMDEESFNGLIDKALENLEKDNFGIGGIGIAAAGPIPRSLLARQDLEESSQTPEFTTKGREGGFSDVKALAARIKGNQKAPVVKGSSFKEAWSRVKAR